MNDSNNNLSTKFDCLIIGGGHNGLIAAAYLAKKGKRVCVLERRHLKKDLDTGEVIETPRRTNCRTTLNSNLKAERY